MIDFLMHNIFMSTFETAVGKLELKKSILLSYFSCLIPNLLHLLLCHILKKLTDIFKKLVSTYRVFLVMFM